jgi:hypothetical protein
MVQTLVCGKFTPHNGIGVRHIRPMPDEICCCGRSCLESSVFAVRHDKNIWALWGF